MIDRSFDKHRLFSLAYVRENGAYVQQMKENKVDVVAHNFDDQQHGVRLLRVCE
jgi:hypothetical protein